MVGLRKILCAKECWFYLCLYDIDKPEITEVEKFGLYEIARTNNISFVFYKTLHGWHFVGLTPLDAIRWANAFSEFQKLFHSYYSGDTIRLSRKQNETQVLVRLELHYGEVIPNLYNLYCNRFNLQKMPWAKEGSKYFLVFEKYRTEKQ